MAAGFASAASAETTVKIGMLNDQSGIYADLSGPGSVWAAKKAVEDFNATNKDVKAEVIFADHQNKADVGTSVARKWFDVDGVDAIFDAPNSGVALAVSRSRRHAPSRRSPFRRSIVPGRRACASPWCWPMPAMACPPPSARA